MVAAPSGCGTLVALGPKGSDRRMFARDRRWSRAFLCSWGEKGRSVNVSFPPLSIGSIIAILVLVLAVVFMAVNRLDYVTGGLLAALAIARLV